MPFYKVMNCKISNFDMFLRLENTYKKGLGKLCPSPLQNILLFFWFVFSHIWTEYGQIRSVSAYLVWMEENTDQKNSRYGHFLRSTCQTSNMECFPKILNGFFLQNTSDYRYLKGLWIRLWCPIRKKLLRFIKALDNFA